MPSNVIIATIFRFNPRVENQPKFTKYEVRSSKPMTVRDLLKYIFENMDNTLAFRRYYCYRGLCLGCLISVDKKTERACSKMVNPGQSIVIEPLSDHPVIRDLVTDLSKQQRTQR